MTVTEPDLPEGAGARTYLAAAAAMTMLAANFEIQNGVLLAHSQAADVLWPGLTAAMRQSRIAGYSAWLTDMVAECERLSAAYVVAGALDPAFPLHSIPDVISRAMGMSAVNVRAYLNVTYMLRWSYTAAQLSGVEALRISSAPLLLPPAPSLIDEPAPVGVLGGAS